MSAEVRRLRVLVFGRHADAEFGGIERHVRSLTEALRGDVDFVNLVERRDMPDGPPWSCPVYRSRSIAMVARQRICPGMPFTARRLHGERPLDIAHLHLPSPMSHLAAMALPQKVRIVLTWHSDIVKQRRVFELYRPFLRRLIARTDAVIAPTPAHFDSMSQLASLVPTEKRVVVPFGFDLAPYMRPHPRTAELRARFGGNAIFAVGRHVYYKGYEYLIRAMALLPQARLVLGGSGPLTDSLIKLAQNEKVSDRVQFVGRIADEDLPAYYQACDVFCLPAVEPAEAFGIVQVEAMAAARPVLCTELGNGMNWVNPDGVTGLAVPPRDEKALAAALGRLFADADLRRRLGEAGRRRATGEFSLEALRTGTLAVYRGAVERGNQSRL
jgi:rhamnosyl/mannosyltransferase